MPAPIKTQQELTTLVNHEANLVGLALLGTATLETNAKGVITNKQGKFKQYTVEEASKLAIAAVNNLVRYARDLAPEPLDSKKTKHVDALFAKHGAYIEAIASGLTNPQDGAQVEYALEALSELTNGITVITSQADVDNSSVFPRNFLEEDRKTLFGRTEYECVRIHLEALKAARDEFCGDKVKLLLPTWKGLPKSELSAVYREGEFNAYLEELEQFLMRQDVMRQIEHIKWCQVHNLSLEENAVIPEQVRYELEESALREQNGTQKASAPEAPTS